MELEQRVEALERELRILKGEIRGTLLDVQESLAEKPASPSRWRKRAWVLALLNLLLSIVLFTNIRLYTPDPAPGGDSLVDPWLQAFWVALAFVWLLLQMYPLALLLDQEEPVARDAAWRNAGALFRSNPGLTLALTLVVLVVAVASVLFPSLWFILTLALLAVVCFNAAGPLLRLCRQRMR